MILLKARAWHSPLCYNINKLYSGHTLVTLIGHISYLLKVLKVGMIN
jgi:hypothetical protein